MVKQVIDIQRHLVVLASISAGQVSRRLRTKRHLIVRRGKALTFIPSSTSDIEASTKLLLYPDTRAALGGQGARVSYN